jgi:transcriptional regulator with PAS, ATPase and Fis domain
VDVRIVAATHRDLEEMVRSGKFREDLYYRLKVIEIDIPPLRDRKEDIPELARVFLKKYSLKLGKNVRDISRSAMDRLMTHSWPGNVRELEHQIERAVAMTGSGILSEDDFDFMETSQPVQVDTGDTKSLESMEREHILRVLKETDYNKSKASEILGIDRATLYRKAQKYGIALKSE